ncbi:MAG: ribosome maturation factor RimM [Thermodesulfobacteriota bacterium]|nr:ribosome maturation factor RimM [Thermodesulfobacteriota bacterium]
MINVADDPLFQVGIISGTHGLRGDLKVRTETTGSQVLLESESVMLHCSDGQRLAVDVVKASVHKQMILLKLQGYDHVNHVGALIGAKVMLAYDQFPALEDGSYYWHQLEGLTVVDSNLGGLGILTSVLETAGHDLYVVKGVHGEVMFPAVDAFIDEIDIEQEQMKVTLPDGLIDLNG